ncbi:hypothetical protein AMK33_01395 [Streptomyces sp. CB02400]|nr:hypothetical protein AMK33_01395 [Streptomyces sp. CB02400]
MLERLVAAVTPPAPAVRRGRGIPPCPAATLTAAFSSALQVKPQDTQKNSAWLLRESFSIQPQALHRSDV